VLAPIDLLRVAPVIRFGGFGQAAPVRCRVSGNAGGDPAVPAAIRQCCTFLTNLPFRNRGTSMSVTTVTRFHAAAGQEATLLDLQSEGRRRMLTAGGCESFDILRDQADQRSFEFVQTWSSREAHDAAFGELIMASGHLEKVLAAIDEDVVQTFYDVVS
jgi:quinol monooxygenase YgiN